MKRIVGFSGGIDSQATARWVRDRYAPSEIILLNSDAGGNEDPITTDFVEEYSRTVFPVIQVHAVISDMWTTEGFAETKGLDGSARLSFELMMLIKRRAPSRKAQFCTEILKLIPQRRWVQENISEDFERYVGLRRDESSSRRKIQERNWDQFFDCYVNYPLATWTKEECFKYVLDCGEPINPLYKLGFNRVGCAPCINSSKEDIVNWVIRRPEMIDKIRRWEASLGRTYFAPMVPGLAINNIDQIVEWAKSKRGGRQKTFEIMHERPACESKYGLCE
jgi:3'-phosphoadenosine 5'-phosphosulfate sulfotransferase (PAPS reductase)/FAD synthetase